MIPEERAFLRALAEYWVGPRIGSGESAAWDKLHASEEAARTVLALGALSVSGEAPPKEPDEAIDERDRAEGMLAKCAAAAGCKEEWSNLHYHGECILEALGSAPPPEKEPRPCGCRAEFRECCPECTRKQYESTPKEPPAPRKVHVTPEGSREVDPREIMGSPGIRKHIEDVNRAMSGLGDPAPETRSVESYIEEAQAILDPLPAVGRAQTCLLIAASLYREEKEANADRIEHIKAMAEQEINAWKHWGEGVRAERDEARARIEVTLPLLESALLLWGRNKRGDHARGQTQLDQARVRLRGGKVG